MSVYTITSNGIKIGDEEISLESITKKVQELRAAESDLALLTITWPGNRAWDGAKEQIVLKRADAEELKSGITDIEVNFGEIAGKHSEIYGTLEASEMIITSGNSVVEFLELCPSGHNYNHSFLDTISDGLGDIYIDDENFTIPIERFEEIY